MSKPEFVYTTYIESTPEKVWKGLTDPSFTSQYWELEFVTDWKPGSPMAWKQRAITIESPEQKVLEYDPFTRLSYVWHAFTAEWAEEFSIDADIWAVIREEPHSRVTFELEQQGDKVKLTVIHDGMEADSTVLGMISGGWPKVLASLKTLLESSATTGVYA